MKSGTTRTTANETVRDIDPGGTHKRKATNAPPAKSTQKVETGDRNVRPDPHTKPD